MIKIRVLGRDPDQVATWVQQIVTLASSQPGHQVYPTPVEAGRIEGDYLAYINVRLPGQETAAPRITRKSQRILARRWRNRRSRS